MNDHHHPQHDHDFEVVADRLPGAEAPADPLAGPIPVEVVGQVQVQEFPGRDLSTMQVPLVNGQAVRVVGINRLRTAVKIKLRGTGTGPAYYSSSAAGASPTTGFQIDLNSSEAVECNGELWVYAAGPNTDTLRVDVAQILRDGQ